MLTATIPKTFGLCFLIGVCRVRVQRACRIRKAAWLALHTKCLDRLSLLVFFFFFFFFCCLANLLQSPLYTIFLLLFSFVDLIITIPTPYYYHRYSFLLQPSKWCPFAISQPMPTLSSLPLLAPQHLHPLPLKERRPMLPLQSVPSSNDARPPVR